VRQFIKSRQRVMPLVARLFGRDIYSRSYYEQVEEAQQASVQAIATWIRLTLKPIRVLDVGRGPGHLIEALHKGGIDVLGLDYSDAARGFVSQKGLPFETFDLPTRRLFVGSEISGIRRTPEVLSLKQNSSSVTAAAVREAPRSANLLSCARNPLCAYCCLPPR
jgi:hypothetical protein